jgi:hypothetical protein
LLSICNVENNSIQKSNLVRFLVNNEIYVNTLSRMECWRKDRNNILSEVEMLGQDIVQIKERCKTIIKDKRFTFLIKNILSVDEFCKYYPKYPSPPFSWQYSADTGKIIIGHKVNADDADFEKIFCHEYYHHVFAKEFYSKFKSPQEKICFNIITEVYAENKAIQVLGIDQEEIWKNIIQHIKVEGIGGTILEEYKVYLKNNIPGDAVLLTMAKFIRLCLNCKKYRDDIMISSNNPGKSRFEQKLLVFFRYMQTKVIPVSSEKLVVKKNLLKNIIEQIESLNTEM